MSQAVLQTQDARLPLPQRAAAPRDQWHLRETARQTRRRRHLPQLTPIGAPPPPAICNTLLFMSSLQFTFSCPPFSVFFFNCSVFLDIWHCFIKIPTFCAKQRDNM